MRGNSKKKKKKKKGVKSVRGIQHIDKQTLKQQDDGSLPSSSILCVVAQQFPTSDRMPPQTTPIRPSLPVKVSVLRQLGIADNELPHGLVRLKHNLLLSPSHTPSQESNICTNSGLSETQTGTIEEIQRRLKHIIEESPTDPDVDFAYINKVLKLASYLDQIALVCLAAGFRECRAPDCLQYRRKLESVVPVCHSWPGLRDWVLCSIHIMFNAQFKRHAAWPANSGRARQWKPGIKG